MDLTASDNVLGSGGFSSFYFLLLSSPFIHEVRHSIQGPHHQLGGRRAHISPPAWPLPPGNLYAEGLDLFSSSGATATALVGAAVQGMVWVFRRETLFGAAASSSRSRCFYPQVAVCGLLALKFVLSDIILSTAVTVANGAATAFTNVAGSENVLRPRVIGSWNFHIASQDLNLALSFVFSSTK